MAGLGDFRRVLGLPYRLGCAATRSPRGIVEGNEKRACVGDGDIKVDTYKLKY